MNFRQVDLGLPPKVQADILNSTPENKQKMIDEFQRQLKGGVIKANPPPRGRSPVPGSIAHNTSPLMPPLSPPKRDASLDPDNKIRPRSSSYFDPTLIPLTRTPTASSLESIDSISPPSSPVILRPESITDLFGHELQRQFEYVLNELHLKEGPRNNIMRTSDETKKREIVRLFWDRQAQLQAQPVVQMRISHPPAPPAPYPAPNPAVGFSQTKRLGTLYRPSMIPPSPLAQPPTVKFPEPSSFFASSTTPHYTNVPRFQPGTAPPPPFSLMPVPENFAVTNSGPPPHFPPRKNFNPPADFMGTKPQRPPSIVSTPPVVSQYPASKTPPTDVPPNPFVEAPANESMPDEPPAVVAPEPEAPPKIESMGTFEMTPALFINQMTNRNTPLKTLFRQLTGLRIQLSFAAPEWIEIFLATTTDAPTQLAKPIRGIQCMQVPLERCRQAKMDRDRVHIQRERDALIKSGVISAGDGTSGAELVDTGGAPIAGRYADDVLEDELLSEVMQCITNVTNLDSGRNDVVASPEMIDQICFALAIDRSSAIAGGGLLSLMTENEPGNKSSAAAVKESDGQENEEEGETEEEALEDDMEMIRKRQQANLELRALVLELLGPICLVSQEGHSLVLTGLAKLAKLQAEPAPMQYLVSSLLDPYAPHSMGSYDDFAAQFSAAKLRALKRKKQHERRRRYLRRKRRLERQARRESAAARGRLPTSDDDDYDEDEEEGDVYEEEEILSDVDSAYGGTEDDDEDYDEALDEEAAEREDREWEYRESVLVFVNGLISVNDNIEERLRIRRSFEQLGFRKVAAILRTMEPSEAVETQLNVFEEDRSGDIEELERLHREKNALLGDPIDTIKQTVERIKNLPRSERTLNLLYSTLAYVSTIVGATLENKRPKTDQGDGPSSPILAAEVDAANETIGDAIAESLSLVKASTATIAGAVVAWEESFSRVEDQKSKEKAKENNRKERFQSLATDIVRALGIVSSVDFAMSELNDQNVNSGAGGGNLIALRQQVLDLRQMVYSI
ncbi:hypothetical protein BJ742DRAFT_420727 [Cladochytrium replicatum]|nr:hypothetical protein BJ742DRAFT_420727 [Cladochytrium replicatum]